jgi:hypothetical protein
MKIKKLFTAFILLGFTTGMYAQSNIPAGYAKATATLAKGNTVTGYAKENIKKIAAVVFMDSTGNKKVYDGNDINTITIDTMHFICISGDFFKVLCPGKLNYLQKASNASATPAYNGAEAIFVNGTEGKIGDYFVYANNKLQLLNKKNIDAFITTELAGCAEAIQQAKASNGDMIKIGMAVETFNSYTVK